jgi:hypothetical protein
MRHANNTARRVWKMVELNGIETFVFPGSTRLMTVPPLTVGLKCPAESP